MMMAFFGSAGSTTCFEERLGSMGSSGSGRMEFKFGGRKSVET
jgi:hypothetical protein